jgi:hypothetical protein
MVEKLLIKLKNFYTKKSGSSDLQEKLSKAEKEIAEQK